MPAFSIFLPILMSMLYLLLSPSYCLLSQLRVTLNDTVINSISTHTWTLTYSNSLSRQQFTLNFPSCVTVQPSALVTFLGSSAHTVNSAGSSSINFTLSSPSASTSYIFAISNVKNCFRSTSTRSFSVFSKADNILQSVSTMTSVLYTEGTISNCALNYNGYTSDVPSTLKISFKIRDPVIGSTFAVRVQYPVYFSSSLELTTYNSLNIVPNYVAICNISINGSMLGISVNAAITFSNKTILCPFVLPSGVSVSPSDDVILHLINIFNPVTSTIYASSTDFIVTTIDSGWFTYDKSTFCSISAVPIATFNANFSQTDIVNANMYPISLSSSVPIPIRLARNDKILLRYSLGSFLSCTGQILVDKSSGINTIIFNEQSTNINQAKLYLSTDGTDSNDTLTIQFQGCSFVMPPSTLPIQFTLLFSGTGTTVGSYDDYMQINSQLRPMYSTMVSSQVSLSLSVATIGDLSTYTFSLTTNQPLSQTPAILIDFPSQITISTAISTLSSCNVAINGLGIGTKSCQYQPNNSLLITLTYPSVLPTNSTIQISIPNIQNPSNPSSVTGFNMTTYYTSSEMLGLVEVGNNVVASQQFTARKIYPQILGSNFTVFTSGTIFTIVYQVGVNLLAGSVTTLTFTSVLQAIAFVNVTGGLSLLSNTSTVFRFNLPAISSGTSISFTFSCLTPSQTGIYSVAQMLTTTNNLPYETTDSPITFQVSLPKSNSFTVSPNPSQSITGKTTDYTFYFTTTVPHPNNFILEVSFPTGTNLLNGLATCVSGCLSSNLTDTSSGGLDRVELVIVTPTTGCVTCFTARVSMVKNQKEVGVTGTFSFRTMTTNTRQLMIIGTSYGSITTTNTLTATFLASDDYYQSNSNPVHIQINITNKLDVGDYITLTFLSNSYTLYTVVGCAEGTCSSTVVNNVTLEVRAFPTATQVIQTSISLEINGLVSSPNTLYGQQFQIVVKTFSATNRPIDAGSLFYSVDCGYSTAIINKNCRTCTTVASQQVCTSCYNPPYSLYNSTLCTNYCGNLSQYQTYPNSGICVPCVAPCFSCLDQINCTKCVSGFYLIVGTNRCQSSCNTTGGYYSYQVNGFLYCKTCTQPNCKSCPSDRCDACMTGWVLLNRQCQGGCASGTYNAGGVCSACDRSCQTCDGPANTNCFNCSVNYYSIDGQCTSSCPTGMVTLQDGTCGCTGDCQTCIDTPTKCLTCSDPLKYYYQYSCSNSCPGSTYSIGQQCLPCTSGCQSCSSTTCIQCLNNYNIFQNKCYQNCKEIGPRYTSLIINNVYRCDQCPDGCSDCNIRYQCVKCLEEYTLMGVVCKRACQISNTCDVVVEPEPVIGLPGFITFAIWTAVIVALKLTMLKGIYVPYALLFAGALIQFVLIAATLGTVDIKLKSTASARLLQSSTQSQPTTTTLGLLAVSLLLNYLMNLLSIWIFCKFIKPLILPRQVDKISNYVVLAIGVLTNYRFYLLAFSRLFKKPNVEVRGPDKLKNLHIILGVSYLLDILTIVPAFMLVLNTVKLTILFMLGIDLIVLTLVLWCIFIYVLIRPKPDEYYSQTKKYSLQENHITEQASIHNNNNDKDLSKAKMHNLTNQKLQVEEYNGEEIVDDNIPTMQPNLVKVGQNNLQKIQEIESNSNPKTKRRTKKTGQTIHAASSSKFFADPSNQKPSIVAPISERNKQKEVANESIEVANVSKRKTHERTRSEKVIQGDNKKIKDQVYQFQEADKQYEQSNQEQKNNEKQKQKQKEKEKTEAPMKSTKYKPGRSSTLKIEQSSMKKKPTYGTLESELADSNIDQVDLQSIIQTKLVDRSKEKREQRDTRTDVDKNEDRNQQYEEISPSWFNIQNQRYDVEDKQQ